MPTTPRHKIVLWPDATMLEYPDGNAVATADKVVMSFRICRTG